MVRSRRPTVRSTADDDQPVGPNVVTFPHRKRRPRLMTRQVESSASIRCSRRVALKQCAAGLIAAGGMTSGAPHAVTAEPASSTAIAARSWIKIRGIYGGFPNALFERGKTPADYGINVVWVGSGELKRE